MPTVSKSYQETQIRDGLYKLVNLIMNPCKYLGLTTFSLSHNKELQFSIYSLAFCVTVVRFLIVIFEVIFYTINEDFLLEVLVGKGSTLRATYHIPTWSGFITDVLSKLFLFVNRSKIIHFHKALIDSTVDSFLGEVHRSNNGKVFQHQIQNASKGLQRKKRLIFAAVLYSTVTSFVVVPMKLFATFKSLDEWPLVAYMSPFFAAIYWAFSYLTLLPELFIVTTFHCFRLLCIDLKLRLEHSQRQIMQSKDVANVLGRFQRLEALVADYNEGFGWYNVVHVLSSSITITVTLFHLIDHLLKLKFSSAAAFLAPLGLQTYILFYVFDEANNFEMEAKKCASLLKQVSCQNVVETELVTVSTQLNKSLVLQSLSIIPSSIFHVNRATLTAIASTITTYLVVLVQFYSGDSSNQ
ncbi:unnamed protein product [Orchesella dallaii]|uniref:Gustatory receptor n=1 Tax=Orchesella dallaii TaxID=48710 RepID=A0ABP1R797_9HEXA